MEAAFRTPREPGLLLRLRMLLEDTELDSWLRQYFDSGITGVGEFHRPSGKP
jgi:hypothetical protein